MLGAECRIRPIGLTVLIGLVGLAPLVPDASGRPATGAAARGHAKRCGKRQVKVVAGKHTSCVPARAFTRGVPRGGDALAIALGRLSRNRRGAHSITAALGPRATAVGRWEDRVVGAGRAAMRANGALIGRDGLRRAAVDDQTFQLHVTNPPGSAPTTEARLHRDSGPDALRLNDTPRRPGN